MAFSIGTQLRLVSEQGNRRVGGIRGRWAFNWRGGGVVVIVPSAPDVSVFS